MMTDLESNSRPLGVEGASATALLIAHAPADNTEGINHEVSMQGMTVRLRMHLPGILGMSGTEFKKRSQAERVAGDDVAMLAKCQHVTKSRYMCAYVCGV